MEEGKLKFINILSIWLEKPYHTSRNTCLRKFDDNFNNLYENNQNSSEEVAIHQRSILLMIPTFGWHLRRDDKFARYIFFERHYSVCHHPMNNDIF